MPLRLVFMGTPDFAVPTLEALAGAGHEIAAAYTRQPRPAGRGMALTPSPVQRAAERLGVPVLTPRALREEAAAEAFRAHGADVAIVVAYGLILPRPILEAPAWGCLNLHGSLLPRWRGAAPIQRAIMAGDAQTGVAVMRMDEGLDTGPVGLEARVPIDPDATSGELHERLGLLGAELMVRALGDLEADRLAFTRQPAEGVTYAHKIANEEARIDLCRPARAVHDLIRGLSPFPGAFLEADLGRGRERIKVLRSARAEGEGEPGTLLDEGLALACGEGAVRLLTVQRAGGRAMAGPDFLRGTGLRPGARLA